MAKNVAKQELKKDVIKCSNTRVFKAYVNAFEECQMHQLLTQIAGIDYIRKARRIVVRYTGDNWDGDACMVACMLADVA